MIATNGASANATISSTSPAESLMAWPFGPDKELDTHAESGAYCDQATLSDEATVRDDLDLGAVQRVIEFEHVAGLYQRKRVQRHRGLGDPEHELNFQCFDCCGLNAGYRVRLAHTGPFDVLHAGGGLLGPQAQFVVSDPNHVGVH